MVLSIAKVWGKQETSFEIDKGLSLFIQLRALAALEGLWRGRGYGGASQREAAAVGGAESLPTQVAERFSRTGDGAERFIIPTDSAPVRPHISPGIMHASHSTACD